VFVCGRCIDTDGIVEVIVENATENQCDYCGSTAQTAIAADLETVTEHMRSCLLRDYCGPEDSLFHDPESDTGYAGDTWDTSDLVGGKLGFWPSEACPEADKLFADLCEAISDETTLWASNDPGGLPLDEDVLYDWQRFSKTVRHQQRFFAFGETSTASGDTRSPASLFRFLGQAAASAGLIRRLPAGAVIFRARKCEVVAGSLDLGPPTESEAKQNRMSPAGIPMFYGAKAPETALREIAGGTGTYHVGEFHLLRPVKILDLAQLPAVPSYWLGSEREDNSRDVIRFFRRFAQELARPIAADDKVHVEYVPTQVLTEFFRVVFALPESERLQGIAYPSARDRGGVCYVVFATRDDLVRSAAELAALTGLEAFMTTEKQKSAWLTLHAFARHSGSLSFSPAT
jgi:hypothetical protein